MADYTGRAGGVRACGIDNNLDVNRRAPARADALTSVGQQGTYGRFADIRLRFTRTRMSAGTQDVLMARRAMIAVANRGNVEPPSGTLFGGGDGDGPGVGVGVVSPPCPGGVGTT